MTNHPWIADADADNSLVCDVLLKLHDDSPLPPPPPPPQDSPAIIPLNWTVHRRRSRPQITNRPADSSKSEAGGASSSNPSRNSGITGGSCITPIARSDTTSATAGVVAIAAAGVDEAGGGIVNVAGESRSKQKETLKAFIEEHKKKNETRRVKIKKKPIPLVGEPQGPQVASPETQGPKMAESQGLQVAESQGPKVADPQGQKVAEPQGQQVAESQGPKVVVSVETQGTEVVATGEIQGPEMVAAGGIEENVGAGESQKKIDDHDAEEEEEVMYALPDLNIPFVDDTFP
ncbi:hypothetical protein L6452_39871 [Arctium lappa]|uniref:Uncharacterized protein n=1 Tax=Arctium lappa TaxID=4217 RepID=A0ACB8XXM8_ARCLA|nr:hypothetical protein L6452_39871 [Arctium lappa]